MSTFLGKTSDHHFGRDLFYRVRTKVSKVFRWYDYILLGVIFIYLFTLVLNMPLFFDEAYNLQVPIMLLRHHAYDTIYHLRSYDAFTTITTGPTVLIPTFLVFKLFGIGVLRARIVQYVYIVALIGLLWFQIIKHYNRFIGFALLLLLYSIPQLSLMLSVIGEFPAIFFVLLGITIWDRGSDKNQNIALLVIGFSVITKLYFGFILLPLLVFLLVRAIQTKKQSGYFIREVLITSFLFLLPTILGEMIKFMYLGSVSYSKYLSELIKYIDAQQVDFGSLLSSQSSITPLAKFTTFSNGMFPGLPILITCIVICGVIILSLKEIIHGIKDASIIFSLSFLIFMTYLLWFVFVDSNNWWRHISPFSILFLFLFGDLISTMVKFFRHPVAKYVTILFLCVGIGSFVLPSVVNQYKNTQMFQYKLSSQREFADEVRTYIEKGYQIGVEGWWQAPEIAFLSGGEKFLPFDCFKDHPGIDLVIYSGVQEAFVPYDASALKVCLGQEVFESDDKAFFLYAPKK